MGRQLFEDRGPTATWPSLTDLQLHMSITTPDGRWYFTGDVWSAEMAPDDLEDGPDESAATFDSADSDTSDFALAHAWDKENGITPYCSFRLKPDNATFDPFMTAMVRAVALCCGAWSSACRTRRGPAWTPTTLGRKSPERGTCLTADRPFTRRIWISPDGSCFYAVILTRRGHCRRLSGLPSREPAARGVYVTGVQEEQF